MSDDMPSWAPCAIATATSIALVVALVVAKPGQVAPVQVPTRAMAMTWSPASALTGEVPSRHSAATLARADQRSL